MEQWSRGERDSEKRPGFHVFPLFSFRARARERCKHFEANRLVDPAPPPDPETLPMASGC
jgi:hypothetical protein